MRYRKFKARSIFTGSAFAPTDSVLITDEEGSIVELCPFAEAGDDIEELNGMMVPGFVNAHCHLELSHMKGRIPPGSGLVDFLIKVIRERGASAEEIMEAMEKAEEEMFRNGIVAVGDTCNTANSAGIKQRSRIHWRNFIEVIGFTELHAAQRLADAEKTLLSFDQPSSLTPHAPYSVSKPLFELIDQHSAGKRISIHNQESRAEYDLYKEGNGEMFRLYESLNIDPSFFVPSGKSSLETYLPYMQRASAVILVHNTYITAADIRFALSQKGVEAVYFCLCPSANKYIESTHPPAGDLVAAGAQVVIGTDSYASNWQLNILEEIKLLSAEFPNISIAEMLRWATLNGAKALEMDVLLGSFEVGKRPGIVLLEGVSEDSVSGEATARRIL